MDRKLADGVLKVQSGEVGRDLMLKVGELSRKGKMIKGRQALFIVVRKFRHDIVMGFYFDITHLYQVSFESDAKAKQFSQKWTHVINGMVEPEKDENLEKIFLRQIKKSTAMQADVAYYRRLERGHRDKCYAFLLDILKRYVDEQTVEANQKALNAEFAGGGGKAMVGKEEETKAEKNKLGQRLQKTIPYMGPGGCQGRAQRS